jgi:acyl transferase domain-containing protein/acyl carrier protein
VKSNIGHAQAAAGMAGLIKMVLALQHEELPRTLHAGESSPHVDWSAGHVRLLTEPVPWPSGDRPRRAGVSSFGFSGTNVHAILQEAPAAGDGEAGAVVARAPEPAGVLSGGVAPWVVSGRSAEGLVAQAGRLAGWLRERPGVDVGDVAWSLVRSRAVFGHRAVALGAEPQELLAGLAAVAAGESAAGVVMGQVPSGGVGRTVFVFPGQGAQWLGMGRELTESSPVFAAKLAECGQALAPYVGWSLQDVLAGAPGAPGLEAAEVVQPVLWAVMVSLAAVWQAAGVVPDAVVGHSQGEIAAACVAGILSLADAAKVVALRSQALSRLEASGGMLSVVMPAAAVTGLLERWEDRLSVAAVNGPAATVVSGDPQALTELEAELSARHVLRWAIPATDFVAHSPRVEELAGPLTAQLAGIEPAAGRVPLYSTVECRWMDGPELDAGYWYANVRQTVRFAEAIRALAAEGHGRFIEVSAHPVLTAAITETAEDAGVTGTVVTGTLEREDGGAARFMRALAQAYVGGAPVDWGAVLGGGVRVELPTYAFRRQRYWLRAPAAVAVVGGDGAGTQAEAAFWAAVEGGDLEGLAGTLAVDGGRPFSEVLPALASWRRRELDRSVAAGWRYRVSWVPVADPGPAALTGTWLLVTPGGQAEELAGRCAQALADHGAEVITIQAGPGVYGREELVARISQAAAGLAGGDDGAMAVGGVVSLLALEEAPVAGLPMVAGGLAGSLGLVQALGDAGIGARLWMLTQGAVAAGGEALGSPVQAQAWGLGRVVGLEHPDRWGGLVDVPPVLDERAAGQLCGVLAGCGEDQVAIRGAAVMARRLVRAPQPRTGRSWVPSGTVLVTGGTGALGGHVARWLARSGAQRLILTSRRGPAAAGVAALAAELAAAGSSVQVTACDAGQRPQLAGLLDRITASGPPLTAVMHTAGVEQANLIQDNTTAELATVVAAKAAGAAYLDELTADLGLDAFVLFSSISAIWGSGLQPAYAAANTFLDALADNRRSRGLAATSVAWGPWDGGGMSAGDGGEQMRRRGLRMLDPVQAVRALAQAVDGGEVQVTITDVDWAQFTPAFTLRRPSPLIADLPEVAQALADADAEVPTGDGDTATELAQRLAGLSRAEQDRLLTDLVRAEAATVLEYPSPDVIEPARAFTELGFDSLTAVELRNRLSAATGLRLPATLLFDYPSSDAIATHLRTAMIQDKESEPLPVLAELDKLESMLPGITADHSESASIMARLETIVSKLKEAQGRLGKAAVAEKLESSSDDEVFDFIGKELGIS